MQHAVKSSPMDVIKSIFGKKIALHVRGLQARGITLSSFQLCEWKVNIPQAVHRPTRHEFLRFVIISEKSIPEVGNCWLWSSKNGGFFGKKDPLRANFHNCFPKPHMRTRKHVFCANFVKFGRPEVGEIARYLMDKKTKLRLALPLPLLRGSRPKFVRDSSEQCTRSSPNFIHIRSLPAEL